MNKSEKCSITQKGRVVIHKGDTERRVYRSELDTFFADGWLLGASDKHRKANGDAKRGNTPWNKGTVGVMSPNSGSFKKGNVPWNKGKVGVQVAWNKGKSKYTDPSVYAMSKKLEQSWSNNDARRKNASDVMRERQTGKKLSPEELETFLSKTYETREKNGTFNTSSKEEEYYEMLCSKFGTDDVKRQYRDKCRYPFRCDFYIVSKDLFIECNFHWTHGGRPFDPEDIYCVEKLNDWVEKSKTSKYFSVAIETWTQRDVAKMNVAKKNNLNYLVVY